MPTIRVPLTAMMIFSISTHATKQNHIALGAYRFVNAEPLIEIVRKGGHQLGLSG